MSKAWRNGSDAGWRKVRAHVLARDSYRCRAHDEGWCDAVRRAHTCTRKGTQAHHTRGRGVTGDDPAHIVACCKACNLHIGSPERHNPQPRRVTRW